MFPRKPFVCYQELDAMLWSVWGQECPEEGPDEQVGGPDMRTAEGELRGDTRHHSLLRRTPSFSPLIDWKTEVCSGSPGKPVAEQDGN